MSLDIHQILIDAFANWFENILWILPIAFIVALYLFFFRDEVSYDLSLTKRERNKLTEKSLLAIIIITTATIAYLYIKGHFFILLIGLSVIMTYFFYLVVFFDMMVEKVEDKYGRQKEV